MTVHATIEEALNADVTPVLEGYGHIRSYFQEVTAIFQRFSDQGYNLNLPGLELKAALLQPNARLARALKATGVTGHHIWERAWDEGSHELLDRFRR